VSHPGSHHRPAFAPSTILAEDRRVLVLYCHPQAHRSRVNRTMMESVRHLPGISVHDLYERYPDAGIDVGYEQALLAEHDTIVLQHPFYWYSTPPLLKEWLDVVLTWGWAYGRGGTALRGKRLLSALTTGGPEHAYLDGVTERFSLKELLAPMAQTAWLCGMEYLPPFAVHGTHGLEDDGIARAAQEYRVVLEALRDRPDTTGVFDSMNRINADLGWILHTVVSP
jgi:glutathione-regulated potassium-efflux system ancillary protein KefG